MGLCLSEAKGTTRQTGFSLLRAIIGRDRLGVSSGFHVFLRSVVLMPKLFGAYNSQFPLLECERTSIPCWISEDHGPTVGELILHRHSVLPLLAGGSGISGPVSIPAGGHEPHFSNFPLWQQAMGLPSTIRQVLRWS